MNTIYETPELDPQEPAPTQSDPSLIPPSNLEQHAQDDVGFNSLDPRFVTVDRMMSLIFAAIVGSGLALGLLIAAVVSWPVGWVWFVVFAGGMLITGLLIWLGIHWPQWDYDRASWRLDGTGLQIRRGVIWRHRISIPIARVQHADVSQGPIQRQFGLGKLTIHTAGTQNASVDLDGLAHETALELRDKIVRQRKSTDVV